MKVILLLLVLPLVGCTTYTIKACPKGAGACTEVVTRSWREFEKPVIVYKRTESDGSGVEFSFGADSATRAPSPMEQVGAMTIQKMMEQLFPPTPE